MLYRIFDNEKSAVYRSVRRLETPTVVWNSECRHMLGVVLRELEGATPGLQDVPAIEVQEVKHGMDRFLKASFSERGAVATTMRGTIPCAVLFLGSVL